MKRTYLQRKLKAFTIMELMIAMVLSCFMVMAALKAFLLFEHLIAVKNKRIDSATGVFQFYQVLSNDMDHAFFVEASGGDVSMVSQSRVIIRYTFEESYAVRTLGEQSDTFKVDISAINIEHEAVTKYVNGLSLETTCGGEHYPFYVGKVYCNDLLMNKLTEIKFKNNQ